MKRVGFLLLIGIYDKNYLEHCQLMKRNSKNYTKEHFELLQQILNCFLNRIIITPQILAEIYSLSHTELDKSDKQKFSDYFTKAIEKLKSCQEHYIPLNVLIKNTGIIIKFGFTDVSIIEAAREKKSVILTDDFRLYATLQDKVPVIYFSSIVANKEIS